MAEDEGTAAAEEEEEVKEPAPPPPIFDELRAKIDAGESAFGKVEEEAGDAEEESDATGEEAAAGEAEDLGEEAEGAAEEEAEAGTEAAAGEEDGGGEEAGEEAAAAEGDDDGIEVNLPGRNEGEEVQFVVSTQAEADDLLRLNKGYVRGEAARAVTAANQADRAEIAEIHAGMKADPAGFILDELAAESHVEVVKALLLDPKVATALEEAGFEIPEMDEKDRELERLKSEKARRVIREKVQKEQRAYAAGVKAVTAVYEKIENIVPDGADTTQAEAFKGLALTVAEAAGNKLGRYDLTRDELVAAVAKDPASMALLKGMGVTPSSLKSGEAGPGKGPKAPPKKKAGAKEKALTPAEKLKAGRAKRRAVASSPAGVGTAPASLPLKPSKSISDRIAQVRAAGGIGNFLRGKT